MAENKKSFVLYSDQISIIDMLPNELAGKLFKHIYSYVNDENPVNDNPMINLAFEPIKLQLKRDLIKWLDTKEGRSKAGKASAEARRNKNEQELTNLTNVDFVEQTLTNPTVNVNDNVNVINKEIDFVIFLDWFNKTTNRNFKSIPEATKKSFKARIKEGYTKEDICKAVINCSKDKFHIENPKYLTPEFISRADKLALYLSAPTETKTKIIIY
jgi:uncharacterized phage protein (TIGR02220 family)